MEITIVPRTPWSVCNHVHGQLPVLSFCLIRMTFTTPFFPTFPKCSENMVKEFSSPGRSAPSYDCLDMDTKINHYFLAGCLTSPQVTFDLTMHLYGKKEKPECWGLEMIFTSVAEMDFILKTEKNLNLKQQPPYTHNTLESICQGLKYNIAVILKRLWKWMQHWSQLVQSNLKLFEESSHDEVSQ